jgi:putative tryptophan/tyrosine transport system substrate-binding protein
MKRREFLALAGAAAVISPSSAVAQPRMPRVGVLIAQSAPHPFTDAFRTGMQALGYVEGRNIAIDWRYADGMFNRAVELATELVRLNVDVIAAHHTPAVKAAMSVTGAIPIVMSPAGAPLETGLVKNLARPGANVTGLSSMEAELGHKRLELLREAISGLGRVAVLGSRTDPFTVPYVEDFKKAAAHHGIGLQPVLVDGLNDFERAFETMHKAEAQVAIIQPLFSPHNRIIIDIATRHRIAVVTSYRDATEMGALMSYSADHAAYFQRAAGFVDRILKGAKPGDLPVEQPTQFEMVLNLKTAKALGITLPQSLLLSADQLIE